MRPELDDLRVLRLAELHERAYERFMLDVAEGLPDEKTRERLLHLVHSGEHGARLAREIARLSARLSPEDKAEAARASLLEVIDVERAALDLYMRHVDAVHDPSVVQLFHDLVREERENVRVAETILDEHHMRARRAPRPPREVGT